MSNLKIITNHKSCTPNNTSMVTLGLTHMTGSYNLEEQYYVYDNDSIISDIGGFLGLFLGYSILSIYFVVVEYCAKGYQVIRTKIMTTRT